MLHALRSLGLFLILLAGSAAAAETKPFAREDMASDAVRLTETLRVATAAIGAQVKGKTPQQLLADAARAVAGSDFGDAEKLAGAAITAAPKDPANWLAYAGIAAAADDAKANDRYELVTRGATAAYAAYQRSTTPDAQAAALAMLGDLLALHEQWRPALDALKASLDRHDSVDVRKSYEAMRADHGFRIIDYKVDNESALPRVCFNFSEPLARRTDFSPYVAVSGSSETAISNEDQQICVEGLKHGERYAIVLRQGLPSAVGELLLTSADYEIYVRDRSPQAHFAGRAYVLPRQGQKGAPLVTVNTAKVSIDVYRVGDRNLLATVNRDDFLKPIDSSRAEEIASQDGAKVWSGTMDVASELNQEVVTDFPVLDAVGKLEPGVYVVTARPWKGAASPTGSDTDDSVQLAAQWMVVSDLGLTAISGDDGVHALVQSLGSAGPLPGVELRLIARNNEVLASKTTGADGRVDFDPGLSRGKGGSAPGLLVATLAGDYNFLSLAQNAFDLSDRGVAGREPATGLDAFLYTERGVYRSGETVFATALLRDSKGVAKSGLPLTLVVKRPDGVEYRRATLPDQGLGGRAHAIPLLPGSAAGKWSIEAYADPKGDSIGHVEFMLQDYIPERLDFTLHPAKSIIDPGEPVEFSLDARFLYGAPANGLDVTGAIRLQAVEGAALAGFPGYVAGLADDDFTTIENQFSDKVQTDDKGHADLSVELPEGSSTRPLQAKLIVDVGEPGGRTVERTLTLPVRAKGVMVGVKKDFDASLSAGDVATFEAIAISAGRLPHRTQRSGLVALSDHERLSVVQRRWPLELRAGQVLEALGQRDDRHRRRCANQVFRTRRLGRASPRHQDARRRGDKRRVRRGLVGNGQRRHARQRGRDARQDGLFGGRGGETAHRLGLRRQGDDRAGWRQNRALHRRRSCRRRQRRSRRDWLRLGPWRLRRGADSSSARCWREAHAGPRDRRRLVRHRSRLAHARRQTRRAIAGAAAPIPDPAHSSRWLAPGEEAHVTVSAVDVGILNLTGFKTPDVSGYFFGQRKLPIEIRDLWGMLIDGMQGAAGAIHTGGDENAGLEGNVPTQEPLALFSGIVKVDDQGNASVSFDLPAFNGSVRLTAVAWSKDKVGSSQADVTVRDLVVVAATLPRFLNVGDRSEMHVDIDNVEGDAGEYKLDLDIHGPLTAEADAMTKTVRLNARQRQSFAMPITAAGIGVAELDLRLTGPKADLSQHFRLRINSGAPEILPPYRDASAGRSKPDHLGRSPRRLRSRHGVDRGLRLALWRARRAGAASGAATLSLWLFGADGLDRDAAPLREPSRLDRASRRRSPSRRAHQPGDRARA